MDNLHMIQLGQYERPNITEERNRDWVAIGDENNYYQCLIDAYMDSTTNQAVINGIVNQIYGKGLDATDSSQKVDQYAQMKTLVNPDCLRKVCQDLKLLGEASFQISYKGKKISKITHFPRETLRAEKMNDDGEIQNYYYAPDWTKVTQQTELKKIPVFGSGAKNELFIIKRYVTGYYYYSPADYNYAYATLESEVADYLINDCVNGFSGTKVVNFNNGVPDREKQLAIKNDVMNKLTGSHGEKVIIAFNNSAETQTTIEDIPLSDAPSHYEYLSEECSRKIMLTHRVTSPLLIGLRDGNSGLGSNEDEIVTAQRLFTNTTIKPYQELIIEALDEIFAVNGVSLNLYFKTIEPLEFMDLENITDEEEREEQTGIKAEDETEDFATKVDLMASKALTDAETDELLSEALESLKGEEICLKTHNLVDVRDVDEDHADVEEWASNFFELAENPKSNTPIENEPKRYSVLDKSYYKVRYRYAVGTSKGSSTNSRPFCKEMMSRAKNGVVYRIEDIDNASQQMNFKKAKLPLHKGTDSYNLFRFKGGVYCRHKWQQVLYKMKTKSAAEGKKGSNDFDDYNVAKTIPKSYKPTPSGHRDAKKAARNIGDNGHHPNYKPKNQQ